MCKFTHLKKTITLAISLAISLPALSVEKDQEQTIDDIMTVTADETDKKPGTSQEISDQDIRRNGGTNFGTIMRYQPLISAPGSIAGAGGTKSSWDRGGFSGYNIRGLDANRVSIDVDGMALPIAQRRFNTVGRAGFGTYAIGRDYIDPYMYNRVDIESGSTSVANPNNALGGSVSFKTKSANYYLYPGKPSYYGYQNGYDSADKSFNQGLTMAFGDDQLNGILVLSRRDGQQTRNYGDSISAYPENWRSNSILAGIAWQATDEHLLSAHVDYNNKTKHSHYDTWNNRGSAISSHDHQDNKNNRLSVMLKDQWQPSNLSWIDSLVTQINYQQTKVYDNTDINTIGSDKFNIQTHYNTKSYSFASTLLKHFYNQTISVGINGKWSQDESPFYTSARPNHIVIFPDGDYTKPQADSRSYELGGFAEDRIAFNNDTSNKIYTIPGVRVIYKNTKPRHLENMAVSSISASQLAQQYRSNSDFQVLPSLALMYDLKPNFTAYLQYKRGAQMPNQNQLYGSYMAHSNIYALLGNSKLKTETSHNFELGVKGQPTDGIQIASSVFYSKYKDFIAYTRYRKSIAGTRARTIFEAENRDKAYIYGAELSSKVNLGTWLVSFNGLSAHFAIGYSQGKSKSNYLGDKNVEIDTVAPMKGVIGLNWDDPNNIYGVSLTSTIQKGKRAKATSRESYDNNGQPIPNSNEKYFSVPGYGIIDLTGYVNFTQNIKLSGGIYNLTDHKYWDYLSNNKLYQNSDRKYINMFTAPGRTFQLGLDIDF